MPQITAEQVETFIFILLRVTSIIATMPILGNTTVPVRVKGGLSLMIVFLLFPFVKLHILSPDILSLALGMAGEVMIGVTIGLVGRLVFAGVQLAGQLAGFQMGFAIVNVFDPITSAQVSIIAELQYLLAMLVFLAVDGHHLFLYAIAESYRIVPVLGFHFSGKLMQAMVEFSKDIFIVAIKTGAPVIAMLLMISIGFGLIARTVPQINILIVGFPLKIAVGLICIGLALPVFARMVGSIFLDFGDKLNLLFHLM
ncbi:MAG TPA: flagellar biosynthetic protein FliR [Anaerolineae bacterium]|nr:flagellar biosynthetic protein FliR [Anaerolineae bacterium]